MTTSFTHRRAIVIFCGDERHNAGERDYALALAAEIQARDLPDDTDYYFCRILTDPTEYHLHNSLGLVRSNFPLDNKSYAKLPYLNSDVVSWLRYGVLQPYESVTIVAAGHSTLQQALKFASGLEQESRDISINYITHMVGGGDIDRIVSSGTHVFAPITEDEINASLSTSTVDDLRLTTLGAVPHTNSRILCLQEYNRYVQTPQGKRAKALVDSPDGFAFAVINAGFEVGSPPTYRPYTAQEAAAHGRALGYQLAAGTHLIVAHGGPRNLRDENPNVGKGDTHTDQPTMTAFVEAYVAAQKERGGTPQIIEERFAQGLPYNIIKAGYIMADSANCRAFICNSEGYSTMDGAVLHINNRRLLLGMFYFQAQDADKTGQRLVNVEKYCRMGIAVLWPSKDGLIINNHIHSQETPRQHRDAAEQIVVKLGLAGPKRGAALDCAAAPVCCEL